MLANLTDVNGCGNITATYDYCVCLDGGKFMRLLSAVSETCH